MSLKTSLALALVALASATSAVAGPIPYPGGGQNPVTYSFTAQSTGAVSAYFLGSGASYDESLGLLVNGAQLGAIGLENHTTPYGTELTFGNVNAGDTLVFFIKVSNTNETYYSVAGMNDDHANHVYSTTYGGDASAAIPAGTYVGFEDLAANVADWNYTDEQFSFTNVATAPSVPEPANAGLLMAGLGLLGVVARGRARK
jgi:hypothetical protein